MTPPLISVAEARDRLHQDGVVFLDASWTYPGGPAMRAEGSIPGARRFDIDTVRDETSPLPHMLPSPDRFEYHARKLGLSSDSEIIVYDRIGLFSAPRVWWMLRTMGQESVRVLDGGLPLWIAQGGPLTEGPAEDWADGDFTARFQPQRHAALEDVIRAVATRDHALLDARSARRYAGQDAEPRPGQRPGHMPGALNMPYSTLLDADQRLIDDARLLRDCGLGEERPVITTCGSGVTACILALALESQGRVAAVYDGSWAEWGSRADTPVQTG